MNVFISFFTGDKPQMIRWANHVKTLGGVSKHNIFILPAHGAGVAGIIEPLKECFANAEVVKCFHHETGWPVSCNKAFELAAWHSYNTTKQPFLWMEPDAIPIHPSWLDRIESEYATCGMPFMGDFVNAAAAIDNGVDHMSGIAVYPYDCPAKAVSLFNNERHAWDVVSATQVVPQMARTNLIHHDWVNNGKWRRDEVTPACVREGAMVYHPDKKGVLMGISTGEENRVGGELRTGAASTSFEHSSSVCPVEEVELSSDLIIDAVIEYAKLSRKNKKEVIDRLISENIIPKAKGAKQPRKKVRRNLGKHRRGGDADGVPVPSGQEVEG